MNVLHFSAAVKYARPLSLSATLNFAWVPRLIDSPDPNTPTNDINLVETARVLCKSPIGGQGQLHQEGARFTLSCPTRTTVSSMWCFKTKRRASAVRATKSCSIAIVLLLLAAMGINMLITRDTGTGSSTETTSQSGAAVQK
jgi:hypothetical protein